MDRLPQELYDKIARLLLEAPDPSCPEIAVTRRGSSLATVSRPWQFAVERETFQRLRFTSSDLDTFNTIVTSHRRRLIRRIEYSIVLPTISEEARSRFESSEDRLANNEAFSAGIYGLFCILGNWDNCHRGSLDLFLENVSAPNDGRETPCHTTLRPVVAGGQSVAGARILWERRFQHSYISLLRPEQLPDLPIVRSFIVKSMDRKLSRKVAGDVLARMPNACYIFWCMGDEEQRYSKLCLANRQDMTDGIRLALPAAPLLETFALTLLNGALLNHDWIPPNLIPTDSDCDPLCVAIREETGHLKSLKELAINGIIDESLFWPGTGRTVTPVPPFWQNLQHLYVRFTEISPSGAWYFREESPRHVQTLRTARPITESPPGYGQSEEEDIRAVYGYSDEEHRVESGSFPINVFRVVPNETMLVPLLEAFARACLQIPWLKVGDIATKLLVPLQVEGGTVEVHRAWGVSVLAPGEVSKRPGTLDPICHQDSDRRRLFLDVMDWRPDDKLLRLFRDIGRGRHGDDLVERNVDTFATVTKSIYLKSHGQHSSS